MTNETYAAHLPNSNNALHNISIFNPFSVIKISCWKEIKQQQNNDMETLNENVSMCEPVIEIILLVVWCNGKNRTCKHCNLLAKWLLTFDVELIKVSNDRKKTKNITIIFNAYHFRLPHCKNKAGIMFHLSWVYAANEASNKN